MKKTQTVDKQFFISTVILIIVGFLIFSSASLGLLATSGNTYSSVAFSQTFYGLFGGTIAMLVASRIQYKKWRKYAFYLFVGSLILTAMVFLPKIGLEHGGARRWLAFGSFSFQPAEFLKTAFILYFAAWLSSIKGKVETIKYGLAPFVAMLAVVGVIMLKQPDTDTFFLILTTGLAMFITAGGKWRHVTILFVTALIGLGLVAMVRPYVKDRIVTFFHPSENGLTSGYQIQQSLIAIGSGGLTGRGFGQSVQKFNFLPEAIGDSIFAVAGEEFGFVGTVALVTLYVFFAFRGLKIAKNTEDTFGRLLVVGIVILIVEQSFVNIGAMLGVLPLSGNPLPFISHGGTALLITLAQVGIILNVSRYQKKT
jgi:cell division protein FtsW